jgi:hypothetical protein
LPHIYCIERLVASEMKPGSYLLPCSNTSVNVSLYLKFRLVNNYCRKINNLLDVAVLV